MTRKAKPRTRWIPCWRAFAYLGRNVRDYFVEEGIAYGGLTIKAAVGFSGDNTRLRMIEVAIEPSGVEITDARLADLLKLVKQCKTHRILKKRRDLMSETYETIHIAKTKAGCGLCEEYAAQESSKPVVVMACEGACLRGELARLTANYLCDEIAPETTARLCLGGAFTKDTGQRNLARKAPKVIAIEGCPIECATRMMQAVVPDLKPEIFLIPKLTAFDSNLFSIKEMPEGERKTQAMKAAKTVAMAL